MSYYKYRGSYLSADEVRAKDKKIQLEIMREWFYRYFEEPADQTPFINDEYHYIFGGPYHPCDVLKEEFYEFVPDNVIHSLVDELKRIEEVWAPTPYNADYDDCEIYCPEIDKPLYEFTESIRNINILLSAKFDNAHTGTVPSMHRLLYANIIIAIEVYLSDTFKNEIKNDPSATRRFVETTSSFKEQKISLSDVYKNMDSIKNRVNDYLTRFLWHRLKETKKMYGNTFDIKFPENIEIINKAIDIRHDIIHRNGKKPDGKYREINETDVKDLIAEAEKFVSCIEDEMNNKKSKMEIERNL